MRYLIVDAEDVADMLDEAHWAGIVYPAPRWSRDGARAIVTEPDPPFCHDDALTDDELAAMLAADPAAWEPPPITQQG